jgi:sirohydrochlorin ferrochelatase
MTYPKLGLILISHGSPSPDWNKKMEQITTLVNASLLSNPSSPFAHVRLAHLEFTTPSIADVCDEFTNQGCTRIIALPIFISVSSHTVVDIPNALNIAFHAEHDVHIRRYLGGVPITLLPTLDHGSVLPEVVSDAAAVFVTDEGVANVGVLILSHGDGCVHFWTHMYRKVQQAISAKTGIPAAAIDWVEVQTGRSEAAKKRFKDKVDEMLGEPAAEGAKLDRLVVVSCFTGLSGRAFLERLLRGQVDERLIGCDGWNVHPELVKHFEDVAIEGGRVAAGMKAGRELEEEEKKLQPPYNPPFYLTRDA